MCAPSKVTSTEHECCLYNIMSVKMSQLTDLFHLVNDNINTVADTSSRDNQIQNAQYTDKYVQVTKLSWRGMR